MLILGIESSCDETAAAVVEDGRRVLANVVASQNELHAEYGGVVPELASRAHAYGAEIVDLYIASRQEVPRRPELIGADGYHPSDEGYARWAELMWAAIEGRIAR